MTIAASLDAAIRGVASITGVSIGRGDDKSTWRIDFAPEATEAERDAAASVIASFDVAAIESKEQLEKVTLDALGVEARSDEVFKGLVTATGEEMGDFVETTFPEMKAEQRAVLKFLLLSTVLRVRGTPTVQSAMTGSLPKQS